MLVFSGRGSNVTLSPFVVGAFLFIWVAVTVHRDMLIASIKGMPFQDNYISCVMRTHAYCICKNNGADHLRKNSTADQNLCFH